MASMTEAGKVLRLLTAIQLLLLLLTLEVAGKCPTQEIFVYVPEDTAIGSVVYKLPTTTDQVDLTFPSNSQFEFDPVSGNVSVKAALDADTGDNTVRINILCREGTGPEVPLGMYFIIENINDNPPSFTQMHYFVDVEESLAVGSSIVTPVLATDRDGNQVIYSILPGPFSDYFEIRNSILSTMHLLKSLDYESFNNITLTIQASDQASGSEGSLSSTCLLTVNVLDVDDLNPKFVRDVYYGFVPETATPGMAVNLSELPEAYDQDVTFNVTVVYSFFDIASNGMAKYFTINNRTAEISLADSIPPAGNFSLMLLAKQVDKSDRQGFALLQMTVAASNDNPPAFQFPLYVLSVPESASPGTTLITLTATDRDYGSRLRYLLQDNTDKFEIDPTSGLLRLRAALDYESNTEHRITAAVTDGKHTATTVVEVQVLDVNDNNPVIASPDVTVDAERRQGEVVARVEARDSDRNSTLTFRLTNYESLFEVRQTGEVVITADAKDLDKTQYDLIITVEDSGVPPRVNTAKVTVRFPAIPVVGAAVMPSDVSNAALIAVGVLAALFFIIVIVLVIYIAKTRLHRQQQLDKAKMPRGMDPKGLAFKKQGLPLPSVDPYRGDSASSDGATTIQDNPLSDDSVNYGYVNSDESETDRDMDEIHIETAVIPYGDGAFFPQQHNPGSAYHQRSVSDVKEDQLYQNSFPNGSLRSSSESLQSEGTGSKKMLMSSFGGGSLGRQEGQGAKARTWRPAQNGSLNTLTPESSVVPIDEKPEITVYF